MNFERGQDVKETLDLGVIKKLPELMKDSHWNHGDPFQTYMWAMEEDKKVIIDYIISRNGTTYYSHEFKVKDYNNEILWSAVSERNLYGVQAALRIPDLFRKETFNMNLGVSDIEGEYTDRGNHQYSIKATNFGAFINVAKEFGDKEIENALMKYFRGEL